MSSIYWIVGVGGGGLGMVGVVVCGEVVVGVMVELSEEVLLLVLLMIWVFKVGDWVYKDECVFFFDMLVSLFFMFVVSMIFFYCFGYFVGVCKVWVIVFL